MPTIDSRVQRISYSYVIEMIRMGDLSPQTQAETVDLIADRLARAMQQAIDAECDAIRRAFQP